MNEKRLVRAADDQMIAGVCAGLARYFNVDVTLVRVIFLLLFLLAGKGFLIYMVLWLLMPLPTGRAKAAGFDHEEIIIGEA